MKAILRSYMSLMPEQPKKNKFSQISVPSGFKLHNMGDISLESMK